MEFVLLIGLPALIAAGYLFWNFRFTRRAVHLPEAPTRRREDARDWQRRFGADSLLATHFLQPTQNELLETLYVLDHLAPGWERADPGSAERHFLNELALSFPSLRKANCEFPLPFADRLATTNARTKFSRTRPASEEEIATRREEFRTARAHANALEQLESGPVRPAVVTPGSLPFRVSLSDPVPARTNPWPARLAGATVLGAAVVGMVRFLPNNVHSVQGGQFVESPLVQGTPPPAPTESDLSSSAPATAAAQAIDTPTPSLEAVVPAAGATASQAPNPAPVSVTAAVPAGVPPLPPSTPDPAKAALVQQVAASKQRAVGKYPELAVEGSEINLRFVFRYKTLSQQNSPRLLDPNWPEKLVEECAAASGSLPKHAALTQVAGTHR